MGAYVTFSNSSSTNGTLRVPLLVAAEATSSDADADDAAEAAKDTATRSLDGIEVDMLPFDNMEDCVISIGCLFVMVCSFSFVWPLMIFFVVRPNHHPHHAHHRATDAFIRNAALYYHHVREHSYPYLYLAKFDLPPMTGDFTLSALASLLHTYSLARRAAGAHTHHHHALTHCDTEARF
jgi:hypothetical protein